MRRFKKVLLLLFFLLGFIVAATALYGQDITPEQKTIYNSVPVLKIHYLGHSAFVLEFDNGITVVTDYGEYNAFAHQGWDSPIHDIGELKPDVMTYSHLHEDHFDPGRIPPGTDHILMDTDELSIQGLVITPVRVCENSINHKDNSAFLFSYKGMKFLHLGDAHADIMNIENPTVRNRIKQSIPDSLDVLFMTIEGMAQFTAEAEIFIDLLKPRTVIPMHYWSVAYKNGFLNYLAAQNSSEKHYDIDNLQGSKFDVYEDDEVIPVHAVGLKRSEYTESMAINENDSHVAGITLEQNYPNPFSRTTTIEYTLTKEQRIMLSVCDLLGRSIICLDDDVKVPGIYSITWDASGLQQGMYFYRLTGEGSYLTRAMILNK